MSDQQKLRKMLEMLLLLSGNIRYTKAQLADKYDISERTVYRYLETFQEAGLVIRQEAGRVSIDRCQSEFKEISELLHFSEEEAYILGKAIHAIDDTTVIKSNLVKKLYSLYDFKRVAHTVVKRSHAENVHQVLEAIERRRQVRLLGYRSASSNGITDRLVEPFDFTTNYISVWCYEPVTGQNKLFKTSRIGRVEVTDEPWHHQAFHDAGFMDVFRISSGEQIPVRLELSLRAKSLLEEEYPLAEQFIQPVGNGRYLFEASVCSFDGVGRFVLGLCTEVRVLEPTALSLYLAEKIRQSFFGVDTR
ncbi:putative DNA-binding transcriptional regulator YafY [Breznakibacter xylanolyticus]|uniref:Putative DNA-binding transcriptional regulator YafY n=1 Tax=Breznakibacter xylanolyticus TaxID=990 RepID=A0A2W7NF75_9BACT|nr:transcriptional regulator [Breznakibacter xylanolyticus]PZX11796.1 putative DNA-binding transcriptional regulator YafY [Breznakibacter xylanolyticus]